MRQANWTFQLTILLWARSVVNLQYGCSHSLDTFMILWTQLNALMGHVEHAGSGTQASLELGFQFTTGRPLPFAPILKKNLRLPESSFSSTLTLSLGGSRSETRCVPRPFYGCRESLVSIIMTYTSYMIIANFGCLLIGIQLLLGNLLDLWSWKLWFFGF